MNMILQCSHIHFRLLFSFQKDIGRRIPCSYSTPRLANPESVRAHPFYTEEPSEEEKDALEKIKEEVREGGGAGVTKTADNPIAQELLKAAKSLDGKLDFSSNAGRKQAVGEFVALVEGKVDLPENRNPKMELGRLIMANYDGKSAEEIMQVIFDKYGFANVKEEKAAAKEAAAEAACANPKNAGLILALGECAKVCTQQIAAMQTKDGSNDVAASPLFSSTINLPIRFVFAHPSLSHSHSKSLFPS